MGIETAWAPKPVRHGSSSAAERECGAIAGVDVAKTGEGRKHAGDGGVDLAALPRNVVAMAPASSGLLACMINPEERADDDSRP
jgi:hypothetical protein